MSFHVCTGALLRCGFGAAPSPFMATPRPLLVQGRPLAVITDHAPLLNIAPFGVCRAPANPAVVAATAAAFGTPTPAPCIPATPIPWAPGIPTVFVGGIPVLDDRSQLNCLWGGVITVAFAGQTSLQLP